MSGDWRDDAVCATTDPEVFFPDKGGTAAPAKRICIGCPVRVHCLAYARAAGVTHGVWGGVNMGSRARWERKVAS